MSPISTKRRSELLRVEAQEGKRVIAERKELIREEIRSVSNFSK
jgi:hypothetical protein